MVDDRDARARRLRPAETPFHEESRARLYALVDLLRGSRRAWSAARLSEELEVSKRTIERDIQSLQLANVPIYADHGATGGYSILREHSLPPLGLTVPDSLAVLAGTRDVEAMGPLRGDAWVLGWWRLRDGIHGFYRDLKLDITGETLPERDPAVLDADLSRWRTRRLG